MDDNIVYSGGRTPINVAIDNGHREIIGMLQEAGAWR